MSKRTLFPTLRCKMGIWTYYVTYFSFKDVVDWIKPVDQIHKSERLSDWIQRALKEGRGEEIAAYLTNQRERFFNALVVGVYGGEPEWSEIALSAPPTTRRQITLTSEFHEEFAKGVGLLQFSGEEKLFAIDGQHRVAGITAAMDLDATLANEEVVAIFVGHDHRTDEGMRRTRRLFTTLNKTAKAVSRMEIIALHEDNGFSLVTRHLADNFALLSGGFISYMKTAAIGTNDTNAVTSIITLDEIQRDLFPCLTTNFRRKSDFQNRRPPDDVVEEVATRYEAYWTRLAQVVPQYGEVLVDKTAVAATYRTGERNHLLFRPVGQRAFATAVQLLVSERGFVLDDAVAALSQQNLYLADPRWDDILWDSAREKMRTAGSDRKNAETVLLEGIDEEARTSADADRLRRLREALAEQRAD